MSGFAEIYREINSVISRHQSRVTPAHQTVMLLSGERWLANSTASQRYVASVPR